MNDLLSYVSQSFRAIFWALAHLIGLLAMFLLAYQLLIDWFGARDFLNAWVYEKFGSVMAVVSLFLVSTSVYFEQVYRAPPTTLSYKFTAPLFAIVAVIFGLVLVFQGTLTSRYADFLSAIALSGAMLRMVGLPQSIGGK